MFGDFRSEESHMSYLEFINLFTGIVIGLSFGVVAGVVLLKGDKRWK